MMFKILVLQTLDTPFDDQTEYQIRDRPSFMRFLGLALHHPVPDAKTVWLYREQLTHSGAVERRFARCDAALRAAGCLAMAVDATVIEARWLGAAFAVALAPATAAAETPRDSLVMAFQIDDLITLDPAEVFEFSGAEYAANIYDRLVTYPVDDVADLRGHIAESWEIADDGKAYTFKVRDGITFHSGDPLTAEDAAWSLQRVIKLNKTPSFILTQFGFTPENVDERIQVVDERTFTVELDQPYAPTFFLYCLTAGVGSVVDKQLALEHEQNGDLGHDWLRTASAGSGPSSDMGAVPFDTIALARKLEAAGFNSQQAQDTAAALAEIRSEQIATEHHINELRPELREVEQRLVIKLGGMMAVAVALIAVLVRLP